MAITRAQQAKQLLALGGRIGLQEGGGIEQRLQQLGGDVTSAEQMLQGINQRLKTAESSLGSGGGIGGLPSIGGLPAPEPQGFSSFEEMMKLRTTQDIPNFYYDLEGVRRDPQGNLFTPKPGQLPTTITRPRPGIGAINFLQSPQQDPNIFGYDPSGSASVQDAYSTAQQAAEKARKEGFAAKLQLPGEMKFDDFSNLYNQGAFTPLKAAGSGDLGFINLKSINQFGKVQALPMRGGAEMMQAAGLGIPAAGYADRGRIGLRRGGRRGDTGQASQSESRSFGGRDETAGRNPMAQFGPPRTQNIVDEVALTGGRTLTKEARDRLEDQRRQATYQIRPSTKPINRAIATALGVTTPFGLGRFLFNKAVDRTAMGFNTPTFNEEDEDVGGDEQNRQIMLAGRFTPYQQDIIEDKAEELSPIELAIQQRDLTGGPRAFAAEGGIMDLEQAREGYKFGKLVKKIGRAVKKIGKSKVGKTALAAAGIFKLGGGSFTDLLARRDSGFDLDNIPFLPEDSKDRFGVAAATGLLAAPFIFGKDDTEDEYQKFLAQRNAGKTFNIPGTRAKPYDTLARAFVAEGGKPEPVAKKTMPLLDMGGKEMDLRAEGGFVPIGRMEKADDVPARLSKNEFVFTADAVRNAGDGNVDKGAEVMYNMMKNLEAGGEVSEESQGREGARRMFQTSQRLEEVL